MPLRECTSNGESGWKWGDAGHCYTGAGAKEKAIQQALAIGGGKMPVEKASEYEGDEALNVRIKKAAHKP